MEEGREDVKSFLGSLGGEEENDAVSLRFGHEGWIDGASGRGGKNIKEAQLGADHFSLPTAL